jgi:GAF domain-containing protein
MAVSGDRDSETRTASDEEWATDKREFVLDHRERLLDERERIADRRDAIANARERELDARSRVLDVVDSPEFHSSRATTTSARAAAAVSRGEARRLALAAVEVARSELSKSGYVPPLLAQFAILAKHLHGSASVQECLDDILHFTNRIMSSSDDVTISTLERAVLRTRAATSGFAQAIDELQEHSAEGPSQQALEQAQAVVSGHLGNDERWPHFGRLAQGVGVLSVLSVCIRLDREPAQLLGTINQYAKAPDAFDRADEEMAIVLAAHAAIAIDSVRMTDERDNVMLGLRTRDVIGQAKGILMERGRLTADQAFDALRKASQMLNRRLAEIAAEVAHTGDLPTR